MAQERGILFGMIGKSRWRLLFLTAASLAVVSCESIPSAYYTSASPGLGPEGTVIDAEGVQGKIVASALHAADTQSVAIGSKRFNYDCSGTILSIYYRAGIDLTPSFNEGKGNGVARLYQIGDRNQLLYDSPIPQPGDLVFWDNTYDRNGDGEFNDALTHAGIVISSASDGTIEYVHHNYSKGIVVERMNLIRPAAHQDADGRLVNSPMRMSSHRHIGPDLWLAGQLYRVFGMHYRLAADA